MKLTKNHIKLIYGTVLAAITTVITVSLYNKHKSSATTTTKEKMEEKSEEIPTGGGAGTGDYTSVSPLPATTVVSKPIFSRSPVFTLTSSKTHVNPMPLPKPRPVNPIIHNVTPTKTNNTVQKRVNADGNLY